MTRTRAANAVLLAMLVVLIVLVLAACGGGAEARSCDAMQHDFDRAYFAGDEPAMTRIWQDMARANCNPD